jgi:hypothetical protein
MLSVTGPMEMSKMRPLPGPERIEIFQAYQVESFKELRFPSFLVTDPLILISFLKKKLGNPNAKS